MVARVWLAISIVLGSVVCIVTIAVGIYYYNEKTAGQYILADCQMLALANYLIMNRVDKTSFEGDLKDLSFANNDAQNDISCLRTILFQNGQIFDVKGNTLSVDFSEHRKVIIKRRFHSKESEIKLISQVVLSKKSDHFVISEVVR